MLNSGKGINFVPAIENCTTAKVAQLVERDLAKVEVAGPSPVFRSKFFETQLFAKVAQLVERDLAKVEVAGPSPVFRSGFKPHVQVAELVDALL